MAINIKALLEKAIYEADVNKDDAYFITLHNRSNKHHWLQITGDAINTYYPFALQPETQLRVLGLPVYPGEQVSLWEADLFLTLTHDAIHLDEIVTFIQAYLVKVMDFSNGGDEWDVSFE